MNQQILTHLDGQSCHADIVAPIEKCLSKLEGVKSYSPDSQNFAYRLWYVNGIVFAYASGMRSVGLRLSKSAELDLPMARCFESYQTEYGWYSLPYDSDSLGMLVNSAYESAVNS
ncbi:MAG: hypothetical protein K1564_11350 [Candidatus Thiodiazotropha sp. (ex. Lucinisca nassula)]|nr:hypothetical protein [Candidatus Thiodiazotropha sp. (ex. Lucinisca nassula)]